MTKVPENFPSYTSYSPRTLIQHVDILKQCVRDLQEEINALKSAKQPKAETKKEKVDA